MLQAFAPSNACLTDLMTLDPPLETKFCNFSRTNCWQRFPSLLLLFGLCHWWFGPSLLVHSFVLHPRHHCCQGSTTMVSLTGQTSISFRRNTARKLRPSQSQQGKTTTPIPADPRSVISSALDLQEKALRLADWISRRNVLCLTGAGLSTDSGIPDYRGHKGSYHVGHKPILHQQFMDSLAQRQRYWGRSMVGWKKFDKAAPNVGHYSLATLERLGYLGVDMEDRQDFYDVWEQDDYWSTSGHRKLTILTQNVDSLHDRAGSKDVLALHGANKHVQCMNCGHRMLRNDYQEQIADVNRDWLQEHVVQQLDETKSPVSQQQTQLRPDGDAELKEANYESVQLPNCPHCGTGFFKPDVVFFGDTVPKHRVAICQEAVRQCDGILVVGSSLAVHSAFRHVRAATQAGISVAILNVGETRAEAEGLEHLLKIEAPIGDTLEKCVQLLGTKQG